MQQLSGLDAAFLALESPTMFGHVGSLCVVDPSTAPEPLDPGAADAVVVAHGCRWCRRSGAGWCRCRSASTSRTGSTIRISTSSSTSARSRCPRPATIVSCAEQAARLHARPLDRRRPLWELYLISGLSGGRLAIYTKVHHAAIDGVSGNDILGALLDLSPEGRELPSGDVVGRAGAEQRSTCWPAARISLARQPIRATRLSIELVRSAPAVLRSTAPSAAAVHRSRSRRSAVAAVAARPEDPVQRADHPAPAVRLPRAAARRHQDGQERGRAHRQRRGDGAVRPVRCGAGSRITTRFPIRRWWLPCPISVRTKEQVGTAGNRISGMIAALPDPARDAARPAAGRARGDAGGQGAARRAAGRSAVGRHPVRDPGARRPGGPAQRAAAAARAGQSVQPVRLQRARAERAGCTSPAPSCWRTTR